MQRPDPHSPRRRRLLIAAGAALAAPASVALLPVRAPADLPDLDAALAWIDATLAATQARTVEGWPLPQVFEHLAQSIEYSISGYPQPRSAWFQHTLGAAASGLFQRLGRMHHDLQAPIPGAPALIATDAALAAERLRRAIIDFRAYQGPLAPHFAYGALQRDDYQRAHLMHIADHRRWILLDA